MYALMGLIACVPAPVEPLAGVEAELGEVVAAEDRARLPDRAAWVIVHPDRIVQGTYGWASDPEFVRFLEPGERESLQAKASLPLARGRIVDGLRGTLVQPLFDAMSQQTEIVKSVAQRSGDPDHAFEGEVVLFIDPRVLPEVVRQVMYTAGQSQLGNYKVLAVGPRLGGGPPSPPDPLAPGPDPSHRLGLLAPTRVGMGAEGSYVIDDRVARIRVDMEVGAKRSSLAGDATSVLTALRERPSDPLLYPTYAEAAGAARHPVLPSVEMLLHLSKHLDDGLMEALQRAREPARQEWLDHAIAAAPSGSQAREWLEVARDLGQGRSPEAAASFLADPLVSMPTGIYAEHEDLTRVFRRDRWLGQDLEVHPVLRSELAAVLEDPRAAAGLAAERAHRAIWTNPASATGLDAGGTFLLAPARSHETRWLDAQGGMAHVREPMKMWIAAIRAGSTSLSLEADSGWYDRTQWALEPFLTLPDPITVGPGYAERLELAFSVGVTLRRETQVKDLRLPALGSAPTPIHAVVAPDLRVEPVPTHWARSAEVYGWLLEHALTRGELPQQDGWEGRVDEMRALYAGLSEISRVDLGMGGGQVEAAPRASPEVGLPMRGSSPRGLPDPTAAPEAPGDVERAGRWLASWQQDPVLGQDMRVIVPVGGRPGGGVVAWAVLGVSPVDLVVSYASPPRVTTAEGRPVSVQTVEAHYTLLLPHFAEVEIPRPLTRAEFRAVGDEHRLASAFLAALADP